MLKDVIYTHDEAMIIVEEFEEVLSKYNICVPSPEDDERDEEDMVGLYGSTYGELLDFVEAMIIDILVRFDEGADVVEGEFSGNV